MRVLMFVPQYPFPIVGGLEKQSHELAKALFGLGVAVQVLSGKIESGQPDTETVEGVPVTRIPWSSKKWVRFALVSVNIARLLWQRRRSFDVIHLHQHSAVGLYVIFLAKLLRKPILTKLPNVGEFGLPGVRQAPLGWLRLHILLLSDAIVAMSSESISELKQVGYSPKRVLRSPNGIAVGAAPVRSPADERGVNSCKVVFVGRLIEQKQLGVLLDAWADVCNDNTHGAMLEIWGEGPLGDALKRQCAELEIAARVTFSGHVEDVIDRMREADVFVLPSRAEGNSNAILEAMVAGLPIVATMVGGTPMLIGEQGRDFLCLSGDVGDLSNSLLRLIKDPTLRTSTGLAMRRRVESHFDIKRVARTYAEAYESLASRQRNKVAQASNPVIHEVA